jgi:hypothetical protein
VKAAAVVRPAFPRAARDVLQLVQVVCARSSRSSLTLVRATLLLWPDHERAAVLCVWCRIRTAAPDNHQQMNSVLPTVVKHAFSAAPPRERRRPHQ